MYLKKALWSSPRRQALFIAVVFFVLLLSFPVYVFSNLWYWESKGPFKNWMQVVDLEGDGDLDVLVSHTRWEDVDLSWAGIGRWINNGDAKFELVHDEQLEYFAAFAATAGDADLDGDPDVFVQDFDVRLLVNQGGEQGGELGKFLLRGQLNSPPAYDTGYRDMGGTITAGDLNGDGRSDAVVMGCCYGTNPTEAGYDYPNAPSISWIWINDSKDKGYLIGHVLPLDFLNGRSIRQAALGDVDGDGDLDVVAAVGSPTMGTLASLDDLLLLNDGTGRLTVFEQHFGNTDSTAVALGDVNGDERLDALVGTGTGASLWINQSDTMANGDPMFVPTGQSFESSRPITSRLQAGISVVVNKLFGMHFPYNGTRTKSVFLADFDNDSDLDALIAGVWDAGIWWNQGQGHFLRSTLNFKYKEDTGLAVGDFDGDGNQDIFTGNNGNDYRVWFNDGNGKFKHGRR